jgi:hypothetical protein
MYAPRNQILKSFEKGKKKTGGENENKRCS